jgi:hypothetical protein
MRKQDQRRFQRVPYAGALRICSDDPGGNPAFGLAKCVDLSANGLRVAVQTPVTVGTYLLFRAEKPNFGGTARVRRVSHQPAHYVLGLELSQPLPDQVLTEIRKAWALRNPATPNPAISDTV